MADDKGTSAGTRHSKTCHILLKEHLKLRFILVTKTLLRHADGVAILIAALSSEFVDSCLMVGIEGYVPVEHADLSEVLERDGDARVVWETFVAWDVVVQVSAHCGWMTIREKERSAGGVVVDETRRESIDNGETKDK